MCKTMERVVWVVRARERERATLFMVFKQFLLLVFNVFECVIKFGMPLIQRFVYILRFSFHFVCSVCYEFCF